MLERNVTIDLGCGNTEEYIIGNQLIVDNSDNLYYFSDDEICALIVPYGHKAVFVMNNGTLKSVDINIAKEKKEGYITDWYESLVLITLSNSRASVQNMTHYIYKNSGELSAMFSGSTLPYGWN